MFAGGVKHFEAQVELAFAIDGFELEKAGEVGGSGGGGEVGCLPEGGAG